MPARYVSVALGVWLFVSAFMWMHTSPQFTNTWLCGVLVIAFSLLAMRVPEIRYLNAAVAVWLLLSVWMLPTLSVATIWNNALVALALFLTSLLPVPAGPHVGPSRRTPPSDWR